MLTPSPSRGALAALLVLALASLGAQCGEPPSLQVEISLHGIDPSLDDVVVVPTDAETIFRVSIAPAGLVDVDDQLSALLFRSGGNTLDATSFFAVEPGGSGALGVLPPGALAQGTWTLVVSVANGAAAGGSQSLSFAVRERPGPPPIGSGQVVWLDFASDRDGMPGPDFDVDLESFGLGSPQAPVLSGQVRDSVVGAVADRVSQVYHETDPLGLGADPVAVGFTTADPGGGDVTRICIGGEDPSGGNVIGSILIDPGNSNRSSVECGTTPPTGIFPREILVYAGQAAFRETFDGLRASRGGVPVGEDPLDAVVLDPDFVPHLATLPQLARYLLIQVAVQRFADALGSITAHEVGHALGMVAPGPPGVGLHGGQAGGAYAHDVTADGDRPVENYLMKEGGAFDFAKLAGLDGHPLPFLRPLDFAYLRDRVMTDVRVDGLYMPPRVDSVSPATIQGHRTVTVRGARLRATPILRLVGPTFTYQPLAETWISDQEMTAYVHGGQAPAGVYDLVLENPDGQVDTLPDAIQIVH